MLASVDFSLILFSVNLLLFVSDWLIVFAFTQSEANKNNADSDQSLLKYTVILTYCKQRKYTIFVSVFFRISI